MMKKAFTLLELVFVIVVIGILAAVIIPNTNRDTLQEAAIQLVSHIRYTQHLAMIDDKFDSTDGNWYKKRWTILFNSDNYTDNEESYTIYNDLDSDGNPDITSTYIEIAVDPLNNSKYMSGGFSGENDLDIRKLITNHPEDFMGLKKFNLGQSYGITSVTFSNNCQFSSSTRLAFDHLGRPLIGKISTYSGAYVKNRLLTSQCSIILANIEDNVSIAIEAETGYAHILP